MKLLLILSVALLSGCAYNSTTITAENSVVICKPSVDKPVDVGTTLQGNVPMQGGTVTNPALVVK